ncbi:MAG: hypothetical protein GX589_03735, partial [Deltaproteobacteria bacterium]|nr:hypothetical protein [Deltaproteobacteria bacterium]
MRLLSLIKPSASAILIGACLAVTACERPAFMDDKRSSQTQRVAVRLVYDPLLRAYLRQSKKAFEKEVPTVSGGRRVELELIEMPALRAAKELASGKLKVEAWLAPSQALINYTNAHLINLGAPQTDCTHLFRSPYVLATRREDILELGAQAQLSWPYVASIINTSKGPGRAPILMHTHPLRAISGPGNLIQLAGLAFKQQDAPLSVADFEKGSQGLDQLRSIENMVSSYGDNDQDLLKRAEKPSSVFRPLVLTTEQQMVQFNLSSNPPLAAIYLSEGSAWQEYALCR